MFLKYCFVILAILVGIAFASGSNCDSKRKPENYHGITSTVFIDKAETLKSRLKGLITRYSTEWKVELNVRFTAKIEEKTHCNIIQMSTDKEGENGVVGNRIAAIFFDMDVNSFLVTVGTDEYDDIPGALNTDYHIIIQQKYVGDGKYDLQTVFNGKVERQVISNERQTQFYNVQVWTGYPYYPPCNGTIAGFKVTNL